MVTLVSLKIPAGRGAGGRGEGLRVLGLGGWGGASERSERARGGAKKSGSTTLLTLLLTLGGRVREIITGELIQKLMGQYPGVDVVGAANRISKNPEARNPAALLTHEVKTAHSLHAIVEQLKSVPSGQAEPKPTRLARLPSPCRVLHDSNCVCEECWKKMYPRHIKS